MGAAVYTIHSEILRNNPLGDPTARRIVVCLPPHYEDSSERYPVVYFLPGFASRATMHLAEAMWDENLPERVERLVRRGTIRPLILVIPDCTTRLGGSQYINSAATGRYEDHIVAELVPWVDTQFRTLTSRDHRAIMGKSSGGYGATVLAMRHPDLFGIVADHSGDKYFDLCYRCEIPRVLAGLVRYENSVAKFLARFPHPLPERDPHWFSVVNMLAMASCYSPNPQSPIGFDLPFDCYTGELLGDVWQRWLAHDPVELAAQHAEALRSLRLYYLDCGNRDEHHLQYGNRIYSSRLRSLDVPHVYSEFDGAHGGTSYRYDLSLQSIAEAFA